MSGSGDDEFDLFNDLPWRDRPDVPDVEALRKVVEEALKPILARFIRRLRREVRRFRNGR